MYRLGPILLPHPGEVDFHQLGLEPYRLPVERYGLPDIHHLREPRQGGEVHGELKALRVPRLRQERLGFGRVIPIELFETLVPVRVPDPWPDITVQLGMI